MHLPAKISGILLIITITVFMAQAQTAHSNNNSKNMSFNQIERQGSPYKLTSGTNEFGIFGGSSINSPTLIGTTENARLFAVGLRYGRVLAAGNGIEFEYTVDAIPVTVVSQPRFDVRRIGPGSSDFIIERSRESVYGAGISPVGFKFNFGRRSRVKPFASTTGGILYFSKQVPAAASSQFNYTFDFSGGIQVFTRSRHAVILGYKFQHISNGGTAQFNPGLDANVIYAGFSLFR